VHQRGVVARHEARLVAAAAQQLRELLVADARQHRGPGDLVAVQVQDGQHRAVVRGVEELVRMPAGRERPGLRLAVADHAAGQQPGVVEHGAVRVQQRIAQLAAFMDGARRFRRHVAGNAARKRELREEALEPLRIARDVRIHLAVRAFQVGAGDHAGPAVARPGDEDRVEPPRVDGAVHVRVDEVQPRRGAPVAQQARLDVRQRQRLAQQRVVHEVDLAHRQVVGRAPPGVEQREVFRGGRGKI
jgi:hypothetical protein